MAGIQLSRREGQVAQLVAEGLTNKQIAERLFIAERTAEGHVEQIRNKLGFTSRSQIAAWVAGGARSEVIVRPSRLPRALTSLVGRSDEIESVAHSLDGSRLVTVTGPGGIGKTRLGIEAARRVEDRFHDSVWLVELASASDAPSVAAAVAHAMQLIHPGTVEVEEQLVRFLSRRNALLILDNCEHVMPACAQLVARLLAGSHALKVLTTSRELLGVSGERVIRLEPLGVVGTSPDRGDAVALLVQRCRDLGKAEFTESELDHAVTICRRLDGIPLAIELAAAQNRAHPGRHREEARRPFPAVVERVAYGSAAAPKPGRDGRLELPAAEPGRATRVPPVQRFSERIRSRCRNRDAGGSRSQDGSARTPG